MSITRMLRYLKGIITDGVYLEPSDKFQVDFYVDAYVAGMWGVEDDQDSVCVKSRRSYLIIIMRCPLP